MESEIPDDIKKEVEKKGGWERIKSNLPLDSIKKVEKIMKVLADEKRLKILYGLSIQKMCVCMLADLVSCSYSKCSYHISKLKGGGLIKSIKKGNYVVYSLTNFGKSIIRHFDKYKP